MKFKIILIISLTILTPQLQADNYSQARRALTRALYKESGLDKDLRRLEKKYLGEDLRKYGGLTLSITRAIVERKISIEFSF